MFRIGLGSMGIARSIKTLAQRISALFSTGQQGAWYEPNDATTLFQDSAGTTPVTAVEQPIGKINDKSGRGNHAIQDTAAARPVIAARTNLLQATEAFTAAAWLKGANYFATADAAIAPDGNMTADLYGPINGLGSFDNSSPRQLVVLGPAGTIYTVSRYVKFAGAATSIRILPWNSSTGSTVGGVARQDGTFSPTVNGASFSSASGKMVAVGNGWYRYSLTFTVLLSNISLQDRAFPCVGNLALTGDGSSGIYNWGAQLVEGANPKYQRVNAPTDYDPIGFPYYEKFDGIDDSLSTTTGGGGTAGFFYCTAIKPTAGAGTNRTLWSDAGSNTGYRVRINSANQLELASAKTPTYGSTLVTNGDFATDTVWAKGTGWTIAAGMATGAASSASITQAVSVTAGRQYEITYTVVTPTAGTVQVQLQGGTVVSGTARPTAGTYTEVLTAATGNTTLGFLGATWSGSIDDVTIREVTYYTLVSTAGTVSVGATNVVTAWDDGTNLNVQIGMGAIASVARTTVLTGTAGFTVGKDNNSSTSYFTGNIFPEIYRKDSGLTAAERTATQRYVAGKAWVTI